MAKLIYIDSDRIFDENGINSITGTEYDIHGFNDKGFNRQGIHYITSKIYNEEGYDCNGFNELGIHFITKCKYDEEGYDSKNCDYNGFYKNGLYRKTGKLLSEEGYDKRGFNASGIHKITKTRYDLDGYDYIGFNEYGFDKSGINRFTNEEYDLAGYDIYGFNIYNAHRKTNNTIDENGFFRDGLNNYTGTKYDQNGYDIQGFDENNFSIYGYNRVTLDKYDIHGYNQNGIDKNGWTKNKKHSITYLKVDEYGFDIENKHFITKKDYDENLLDINRMHIITKKSYKNIKFKGPFYKETIENLILSKESISDYTKNINIDVKIMKKFIDIAKDDSTYASYINKIYVDTKMEHLNEQKEKAQKFIEQGGDIWSLEKRDVLESILGDEIKALDLKIYEKILEQYNNDEDIDIRALARYYNLEYKLFSPGAIISLAKIFKKNMLIMKSEGLMNFDNQYLGHLIRAFEKHRNQYTTLINVKVNDGDREYIISKEDEEKGKEYVRLTGKYPSHVFTAKYVKKFASGELSDIDLEQARELKKIRTQRIVEEPKEKVYSTIKVTAYKRG